ncbi:MAG: thiamine phosphate synthase [Alphaproteobacteria bacterium]|nr:thiamine phosphate synthase [Alphaproteobacteria bacterium]
MTAPERPRLYLVAPAGIAPDDVLAALGGGDVAALELIAAVPGLIAAIQARGVAVLVRDDVAAARGADGVVLSEPDADVADARRALGPGAIVGACAATRHGAMVAGEAGADVLAFDNLDLLAWWAGTMVVPCLARGIATPADVAAAVAAGADFLAVDEAVWHATAGPADAIAALNEAVDRAWPS